MKHLLLLGATLGLLAGCSLFTDSKPQAEAQTPAPAVEAATPPTEAQATQVQATPAPASPARAAVARGPVRFSCTGSAQTLTVTYPAGSPATARVQYGTQSATAAQRRTGSGARYVGTGVDFWDRGGGAADLVWKGRKLSCKQKR